MTPTEYEFLQDSIRDIKRSLENVRSEVHGNAITQGNALTAVAQKVSDLQDRLFLDSTSAIPRLTEGLASLDKRFTAEFEKENETCMTDRKEMRNDIVSLKVKMAAVSVLYGLCAGTFVNLIVFGLKYVFQGHF